jgi:hypothetical protein
MAIQWGSMILLASISGDYSEKVKESYKQYSDVQRDFRIIKNPAGFLLAGFFVKKFMQSWGEIPISDLVYRDGEIRCVG